MSPHPDEVTGCRTTASGNTTLWKQARILHACGLRRFHISEVF